MKIRPLRDRRLQPNVKAMRRYPARHHPDRRQVRLEREGNRLVRYLTCLVCRAWYEAGPAAPLHCGRAHCAEMVSEIKRTTRVNWG